MTSEILNRILALLEAMASIQVLIDAEIVRSNSDWLYNRADQLHREIMALGEAVKSAMPDKKKEAEKAKEEEKDKKSCFEWRPSRDFIG